LLESEPGTFGNGTQPYTISRKRKAEPDSTMVEMTNISHAVAFLAKGNTYFSMGRFYAAKHYWERVVKLQPSWAFAWYNLGLALGHLGKRAKALQMLQRALKRDSALIEAYVERALLYEELGKPRKAKREYTRALRIAPVSPRANYNLGSLLFDQGCYGEAAFCFRRVLRVDPTHASSYDYLELFRRRSKCASLNQLGGTM